MNVSAGDAGLLGLMVMIMLAVIKVGGLLASKWIEKRAGNDTKGAETVEMLRRLEIARAVDEQKHEQHFDMTKGIHRKMDEILRSLERGRRE